MPNTYTKLLYHIVFSTKRREPLIQTFIQEELYEELRPITRSQHGIPLEVGGMADHVHLVAWLRPDQAVSKVVQHIKGGSSSWLNQQEKYPGKFYWQEGYGAFTVSPPQLAVILEYVQNQAEHHRYHSFQEEYRKFLDQYEIAYDERYIWE